MSLQPVEIELSARNRGLYKWLVLIGAATLLIGLFAAPQRIWANLLLVGFYTVSLGLGGAFFIALQYACNAGWAVAIRRVPEAMCKLLPIGALGIAAVLLLGSSLYAWVDAAPGGHLLAGFKGAWLSRPFFVVRGLGCLGVWILLAGVLVRTSRRQDVDGDPAHTHANRRTSGLFIVLFSLTLSLASFDWIMSLEPEWYSTIFAIYNFAGLFVSTLSVIVLLSVWLRRRGIFRDVLTDDHLHDLGKLMLAFSTFWGYIWFSQYMLIWYANIPEETGYYILRQHGVWGSLFLLNFIINWAVPFFVLLPRGAKRDGGTMVKVAVLLLIGHWLDLYLMIMPSVLGDTPRIGVWEIGLLGGAIGLCVPAFLRGLRAAPATPMRDPYLHESLHYHQ